MQLAHLMVGLNYPVLLSAHFLPRSTNEFLMNYKFAT